MQLSVLPRTPAAMIQGPLRARRGAAPLEFVMALPLLCALVYCLFCIVRTTMEGLGTVQTARHDTFRELPEARPVQPLRLDPPIDDGAKEAFLEKAVEYDGWFAGLDVVVQSGNRSLGGTWDKASVPFPEGRASYRVHPDAIRTISGTVGLGGLPGQLDSFSAAMSLLSAGR
jgi:hypothetical protein